MKTSALIIPLVLLLSGCLKFPPSPPTACLSVYAKFNGVYNLVYPSNSNTVFYIGDTIKFVSCSKLGQKYTWTFGDGTTSTTTDSIVYHVYTGYQNYNTYVQVRVTNNGGADSAYFSPLIIYPLWNYPTNTLTCWCWNGYSFMSNADSTILYGSIGVITGDSISAVCHLINPRTFTIPLQNRISTSGIPYTISGQGNVYTYPNNGGTYLALFDMLIYATDRQYPYTYTCHDTVMQY